ncbi:MAG: hypothetical protein JWQ49_5273 [Edaphobacter sp.]|nr:hypothetical protein [Edaphobacter sp.]
MLIQQPTRRLPMKVAPRRLPPEQLHRILDLSTDDPTLRDLHDVVMTISNIGIRPRELPKLRWCDFDVHGRRLLIADRKRASMRFVPLDPEMLQMFEVRGGRESGAEYIFGTSRRALLYRVSRQLGTLCDRIGASGVTLHLLRRSFFERVQPSTHLKLQ